MLTIAFIRTLTVMVLNNNKNLEDDLINTNPYISNLVVFLSLYIIYDISCMIIHVILLGRSSTLCRKIEKILFIILKTKILLDAIQQILFQSFNSVVDNDWSIAKAPPFSSAELACRDRETSTGNEVDSSAHSRSDSSHCEVVGSL